MTAATRYHELILDGARALGSDVESGPSEWTASAFNVEVLGQDTRRGFNRQEKDLPSWVASYRVAGTPLLLGELTGPPQPGWVTEQVRRYRNQAAIARSWLGVEGPSLQLFLLGPTGALHEGQWIKVAAGIEADDRVCRKLVWLFEGEPTLQTAIQFLGRTFVATPWDPEDPVKKQLDQITEVGLPSGWQEAVDNDELDVDGLIDALIDLEPEAE